MFLVLRQDCDGEVLIAAIDKEGYLPEIVVRDIGKRFPPDKAPEEHERERFLLDAFKRLACEYKLVAVT